LQARLDRMLNPQDPHRAPSWHACRPRRWARSDAGAPTLAAMLSPSRILVVDDYPVSLKLLEKLFKDEYQVMTATDGAEALTQFVPDQSHCPIWC
jgi:PleD family two-component response regulator